MIIFVNRSTMAKVKPLMLRCKIYSRVNHLINLFNLEHLFLAKTAIRSHIEWYKNSYKMVRVIVLQ